MADEREMPSQSRADTTRTNKEPRPLPQDLVRNRAYDIYTRHGGEDGHEWDDWLQAERELRREQDE